MGAKKDPKKDAKTPSKTPKKSKEGAGGKAKKKKWSKGKTRDKLNNLVLFDKGTYDKLYKEVGTRFVTNIIIATALCVPWFNEGIQFLMLLNQICLLFTV